MEIPAWPDTRPLLLGDKAYLDRLCAARQPRISELSFAGLYLFRQAHSYHLTRIGMADIIIGAGYDGSRYALPPMGADEAQAREMLLDSGLALYGIENPLAKALEERHDLIVSHDRNASDYLYLREELATLPGSRYHKKRNRISYFTARHRHQTALCQSHHLPGCLKLLREWEQAAAREESRSLAWEVEAAAEALEQAEQLGLQGVVITVDGIVRAFALGERLNRETAVCHFEKADPFLEGIAQLVNREFARLLFSDCIYINREQDLGEPGLRNAKLSYHPVELVEKYRIRKK